MPCIRLQMARGRLQQLEPIELLGRSSQCLADLIGGGHQFIMALWEPVLEPGEKLRVDILAIGEEDLPDEAACRLDMGKLFTEILSKESESFRLTIRESERSEWDAWEAGAVDGFRVVYGLYDPGRAWQPAQ